MLLKTIIKGVLSTRASKVQNQLLLQEPKVTGANEFLFFIKPELLLDDPSIRLESMPG